MEIFCHKSAVRIFESKDRIEFTYNSLVADFVNVEGKPSVIASISICAKAKRYNVIAVCIVPLLRAKMIYLSLKSFTRRCKDFKVMFSMNFL